MSIATIIVEIAVFCKSSFHVSHYFDYLFFKLTVRYLPSSFSKARYGLSCPG